MAPTTPNLRVLRSRPLCIICARAAEAEEIAKALGIEENRITGNEVQKVNDGYTFYLGSFNLPSGEELKYYVTSSLRQGIQSFTVNASILFSILRPRFVIHAGVCAGYYDPTRKLKMEIADVVFGEAATNYQEGKAEYVDGELKFWPDYNRITYTAGNMQAFADSGSRPNYHYGEFITGSSVRTDASHIFRKIRSEVNRNAIALDMEASAFLQLCQHFEGDQAISLGVIKGISDFGDSAKGTIENAYKNALKNTAAALEEWVTYRIKSITWTIDESDEPGAKLVPGYYDNFIRRVLDNYLQGWPVIDKVDRNIVIPREEIKGFKTVLPKDRDPSFAQEFGQVQKLVERYHITEVDIGGSTAGRYLHYKAGYFIDWVRTVNSLKICEDGQYQVGVFERLLSKTSYYSGTDELPALASVETWEDTVQWLKDVEKEEAEAEQKRLEEKEKTQLEEEGQKADAKDQSQEQDPREGRRISREEPLPSTVLDKERQESPSPLEGPATQTDGNRDINSTTQNGTSEKEQSRRAASKSSTGEPKGFTFFPTRPGGRKTVSPKRSISRFFTFRKPASADPQDDGAQPILGK